MVFAAGSALPLAGRSPGWSCGTGGAVRVGLGELGVLLPAL